MSRSASSSETVPVEEWCSDPEALEAWELRKDRVFGEVFRPAPQLRPSEWSEAHRVVSTGPEVGMPMRNEQTPYLVEILDFVADPWASKGVVIKGTRIGYTEYVVGNAIGYTVDQDPCNICVLQPSDKEAEGYSKEQIGPMIERNPRIRAKVGPVNTRRSDSTMTYKEFPGGYLLLLGSASDKNLRRRSLKRALADEVDAMKVEGAEGDPLLRYQKRTDDYEDGIMLMGSTPTVKGLSRIDREYERSDQREWHVPCPHCEELQPIRWGGPETAWGFKWEREYFCKACGGESSAEADECASCGGKEFAYTDLPDTVYYECAHCHERIEEAEKESMIRLGCFVPQQPKAEFPGWKIPTLISLFPGARWSKLVSEFVSATRASKRGDHEDLQVFVNCVLAEAWEEPNVEIDDQALADRAEAYPADVPDGVGVLVASVDVQHDRLELLIRGFGTGEESWQIMHARIYGDPGEEGVWASLDGLLTKPYLHPSGAELRVAVCMVDTGDGKMTTHIYRWVAPRQLRGVFALKGGDYRLTDALKRAQKPNKYGIRLWSADMHVFRSMLYRRLQITVPGPGYYHFRLGTDREYFAQLEAKVPDDKWRGGRLIQRWKNLRERDEGFDLETYCIVGLHVLGPAVRSRLPELVETARAGPGDTKGSGERTDAPVRLGSSRRSGWVGGWKR